MLHNIPKVQRDFMVQSPSEFFNQDIFDSIVREQNLLAKSTGRGPTGSDNGRFLCAKCKEISQAGGGSEISDITENRSARHSSIVKRSRRASKVTPNNIERKSKDNLSNNEVFGDNRYKSRRSHTERREVLSRDNSKEHSAGLTTLRHQYKATTPSSRNEGRLKTPPNVAKWNPGQPTDDQCGSIETDFCNEGQYEIEKKSKLNGTENGWKARKNRNRGVYKKSPRVSDRIKTNLVASKTERDATPRSVISDGKSDFKKKIRQRKVSPDSKKLKKQSLVDTGTQTSTKNFEKTATEVNSRSESLKKGESQGGFGSESTRTNILSRKNRFNMKLNLHEHPAMILERQNLFKKNQNHTDAPHRNPAHQTLRPKNFLAHNPNPNLSLGKAIDMPNDEFSAETNQITSVEDRSMDNNTFQPHNLKSGNKSGLRDHQSDFMVSEVVSSKYAGSKEILKKKRNEFNPNISKNVPRQKKLGNNGIDGSLVEERHGSGVRVWDRLYNDHFDREISKDDYKRKIENDIGTKWALELVEKNQIYYDNNGNFFALNKNRHWTFLRPVFRPDLPGFHFLQKHQQP